VNVKLNARIVSDDDGQTLDATIEAHGTPDGMGDLLAKLLRGVAEVHGMADPEIPEAAIRARAEVWFTHWRDEVAGGDAHGMTAAHFEREVREVLAAALPHLDTRLDRERLHREGYDYARTQGWNPRGANRFAAHYVEQVTSGLMVGNYYRTWDVQQVNRRDFDPGWW